MSISILVLLESGLGDGKFFPVFVLQVIKNSCKKQKISGLAVKNRLNP